MVDDNRKNQTKKALLGELESIKSLLEPSQDDVINFDDNFDMDEDEPPILTTAIDDDLDPDDHEDIPVLTEAFETGITGSESDDEIKDEIADFEEPKFEQWPENDTELDDDIHPDQALVEKITESTIVVVDDDEDGTSSSIFDDLEIEFEQHFGNKQTTPQPAPAVSTKTTVKPAPTPAEKKSPVHDTQPSLFDPPEIKSEKKTSASSTAKLNEDTKFSKPDEKATPLQSTARKDNIVKATSHASIKPDYEKSQMTAQTLKTDNPFLPKHIRDRLHTSRSLQDEIMDSSLKSLTTAIATKPSTPNQGPANPIEGKQEQLIDELVQSYLPKIEQELRRRLQALLSDTQALDRDDI
jgi:hypothetical protein